VSDENTPTTPDDDMATGTNSPASNTGSQAYVANSQAATATDANAESDEEHEARRAARKEWIKFVVLVVVLFGAIFVVWAVRPLIFGQIVPAVLTANPPTAVVTPPDPATSDLLLPAVVNEETQESTVLTTTLPLTNTVILTDSAPLIIVEQVEVTVEDTITTEGDTAVEQTTTLQQTTIHVVQRGDSLYTIAQRYGTTIQDIINANPGVITNPNNIQPGTSLTIPVPPTP
jgi:LysM repeat protein